MNILSFKECVDFITDLVIAVSSYHDLTVSNVLDSVADEAQDRELNSFVER